MVPGFVLSFVAVLLTFSESAAHAAMNGRLQAELQGADPYIRAIVQQHEEAFPDAMNYDYLIYYTSLGRLSWVQQGVLSELLNRPDYIADWKNREPLTDFKIRVQQSFTIESGSSESSNQKWWDFRDALRDQLPEPGMSSLSEYLSKQEKEIVDTWAKQEKSQTWMALSDRQRLARYILFVSLIRARNIYSLSDLRYSLYSISESSLNWLKDPHYFVPLLEKFLPHTTPARFTTLKSELEILLPLIHDEIVESLSSKQKKSTVAKATELTVREVHPNIAILRGYVGNDCSTSFSPGFVFTPFDRYYYVFDGKERLGYVGLSLVQHAGKRAILIHTIQGPGFSEAQTHIVMRGFQNIAGTLFGAAHTFLSRDQNISANVNFSAISRSMQSAVAGQKELSIDWHDMHYREIIHRWDSTMTYDDPNQNRWGRELKSDKDSVETEITQRPFLLTFSPVPRPQEKGRFGFGCSSLLW